MANKKVKSVFICQSCDYKTSKWLGLCPGCKEWNTFVESEYSKSNRNNSQEINLKKLSEIIIKEEKRESTGLDEFDRVVGGGLVKGSLILIGGEPGVGKSTLISMVMSHLVKDNVILYISGEESLSQVAKRLKRIGINSKSFLIYHETNWKKIHEQIKKIKPDYLVLDSIQTVMSPEINSPAGSPSQVKEITYELMNHIKAKGITSFVIGHITKEGSIAGPKMLEHMVDTVVYFESGDSIEQRVLRAIKNRFGPTDEIGIFEIYEKGLKEILNLKKAMSNLSRVDSIGSSLSCIMEGSRAILIEAQSLVIENNNSYGKRTTQGYEYNRLLMLLAIIEKHINISMSSSDIYLNLIGNIGKNKKEMDLSIMASLISSFKSISLPMDTVFIGEVGLNGEVLPVKRIEKRIKELSKKGFKKIITHKEVEGPLEKCFPTEIIGIKHSSELNDYLKER